MFGILYELYVLGGTVFDSSAIISDILFYQIEFLGGVSLIQFILPATMYVYMVYMLGRSLVTTLSKFFTML